ncbi:MAG: transcriptional repressor [Leptospiraceae bacterium]|nr:transcriptional repressor [Leptospiraceae bacterium]
MNHPVEEKPTEVLKEKGLKATKTRIEVLNLLQKSKKPLNHSQVMEMLPGGYQWDRVTIYRTLSEFEDRSIINSLLSKERITYFEIKNIKAENHSHLICDNCGSIECLKKDFIDLSSLTINGFKVKTVEISYRGLCKSCQ